MRTCLELRREGVEVASVPVMGTPRSEAGWVETGLMFFSVDYLKRIDFIRRYDWPSRTKHPTPEAVIRGLLGADLRMMRWRAMRGDKHEITAANVAMLDLDWLTHCWDDIGVYDAWIAAQPPFRLNFGCGTNRVPGWINHDADVDVGKPIPYPDWCAELILAEHVVEHLDYYAALRFFEECYRVLQPGGVLRVCVPSIENVWKRADPAYCEFTTKWQPAATVRGAMHAILHCHGHKSAWTQSLLEASLAYAGFKVITACEPGASTRAELRGVDGHARVIGEHANWVETAIAEAVR